MLDFLNIERQIGKRIRKFLLHKATEQNIDLVQAKLVINIVGEQAAIHLYSGKEHRQTLTPQSIAQFFGKEFDEDKTVTIKQYLLELSDIEKVQSSQVNLVVCDNKDVMGAFLFDGGRYVKKMKLLEIVNLL